MAQNCWYVSYQTIMEDLYSYPDLKLRKWWIVKEMLELECKKWPYNKTAPNTIFESEIFGFISGQKITQTIIRMEGYKSISGNYIRIDSSGDSEGNFTAFAVKPHNYTFTSRITKKVKFSCGYYPIKVILDHSK